MKKLTFLFGLLGLCSLGTVEAATYYSSSSVVQPIYTYPDTYHNQVDRTYYYSPNTYSNYSQNLPSNYYNVTRYPDNYITNPYNPYYDYNEYDYPGNYPIQGSRDYQYYSYPDQGYYYNANYNYRPTAGYSTSTTTRTIPARGTFRSTTRSTSTLPPSGRGTLNY